MNIGGEVFHKLQKLYLSSVTHGTLRITQKCITILIASTLRSISSFMNKLAKLIEDA